MGHYLGRLEHQPTGWEQMLEGVKTGLNTKMQELYETRKKEESSKGLANLLLKGGVIKKENLSDIQSSLASLPTEIQPQIAKLFSDFHEQELKYGDMNAISTAMNDRSNIDKNLPQTEQQFPQSEQPIAQKTSLNEPGQAPMLPYGQIPAKEEMAQPGAINGPKMAIPEPAPQKERSYEEKVNDADDWLARNLKNVKSQTGQEYLRKEHKDMIDRYAKEEANEEKRKSRLQKVKEYEEKKATPSKEDKKFVDETNIGLQSGSKVDKVLNKLKQIRLKSYIGPGSWLFQENRKARAEYSVAAKELLPLVSKLFPRGLTEKTFKRIEDIWMPTPGDTEATLEGKEKGFEFLAKESKRIFNKMKSFQNPDGSYPKDIQSKVMSSISDDLDNLKDIINDGPEKVSKETSKFKAGDVTETLPSASSIAPGKGFKDDSGNVYVSDGKKWTKK